jgi:hypothetical protein
VDSVITLLAGVIMLSTGLMVRSRHGSGWFRTGWVLIAVSCLGLMIIAGAR